MSSDRPDLRALKPLGRFRAVETRDGEAAERDGQVFYAATELKFAQPLWEVMFEDGMWMLASPGDLEWA